MLNATKDSILVLFLGAIIVWVYKSYYEITPSREIAGALIVLSLIMSFMSIKYLASLGASILLGSSYDANKEVYTMSVAIFNQDKGNRFVHLIKLSFLGTLGAIFLPFAILASLFNIKSLFKKDEAYDEFTQESKNSIDNDKESDIEVKTPNKKWKISTDDLYGYYFHTEKEAIKYAIKNDLSMPEKI